MPLLNTELARRDLDRMTVRPEPLRLRWTFDDLVSADGHNLILHFSCSAKALPDPTEQRLLEETFLGASSSLTTDAVREHFRTTFRTTAAQVAHSKPADQWLGDGSSDALIGALKTAGKRLAFSCGLELLPPFQADLESPTLEQQRVEQMQRSLAEQRAAGQVQHFQRAAELFRQFEAIRASAPSLSPGEILRQINPAEQGMLLQTLLLASGKQHVTSAVWAVAGPNLVRIDPRSSPPKTGITPLPTTLGPLRSVQPTRDGKLLVGARAGVFLLHPDQPSDARSFADPTITSPLGFNRAVLWRDEVYASHSDAGLVGWKLDQPDRPCYALRATQMTGLSPKNVQALDDNRLVFSSRNQLLLLTRSTPSPDATTGTSNEPTVTPLAAASAEIIAVLPDGDRLITVLKNGVVQLRDAATLAVVSEHRRAGDVCSAALMPWLGSTRLLLATDDGPILCVGLDDDLVTQYLNPFGGLRALASSSDLIAALSGDRQRILLYHPWNPRQPTADLFIAALAKHRAADVDL